MASGATQIATPYVTCGPLRDWLDEAAPFLANHGIAFCEWRREWDTAIWPHATAGFFKVKQNIPRILEQALGQVEARDRRRRAQDGPGDRRVEVGAAVQGKFSG